MNESIGMWREIAVITACISLILKIIRSEFNIRPFHIFRRVKYLRQEVDELQLREIETRDDISGMKREIKKLKTKK